MVMIVVGAGDVVNEQQTHRICQMTMLIVAAGNVVNVQCAR